MNYLLTHSIERSAKRFPERQAFVWANRSITFAELHDQTNQLANSLIDQGVKKGDRVGIYMNRSLESAIAVYGIMKAGAAYVPLDTSAPTTRTQFLINDCEINHLITIPVQKRALKAVVADDVVALDSIIGIKADWHSNSISWEEVQAYSSENLNINILDSDLAYIMYTSGSTGAPKGIMHTHSSGLAYARLSADLYNLTENDRIGNHAPLHFDISTMGYFTAPLVGATSVIVPEPHTKMPASLAQLIEQEKLTIWYSVPLALIQMLQGGALADKDFSALRWILYGGEPFPAKHLRSLMELWPDCQFSNVYGPAEVNQCTYYTVSEFPKDGDAIPLGRVWNNTASLVLDEKEEEVQGDEIGELLIRSATMMRGYWRQPELTQRSLYKRKANGNIEETFYRTGDLVKRNAKGELLFMGRKDRQIKVRGYRVELDEVANVLLGHPSIEEAAVFPIANEGEEKHIEAAVILKADVLSEEEILKHCSQSLPKYATPEKIIITKAIPRTSNGKINHLELQGTTN